jgi:hypothetical protein
MTGSASMPGGSSPGTPMYLIGAVVLVGVLCYAVFMAIDTFGLESTVTRASVVSTGYRAAGQTYVTEIINNRPYVIPKTVPEAFLADVEIDGAVVTAAVDKAVHDRLRAGDPVTVTIRRTRLTGRTQVVGVE